MRLPPPIFDAQIRVGPLPDQDLADLRFFGVVSAVAVAGDDAPKGKAQELLAYLEDMLVRGARRLKRAGIAPYFALGVHPARIPERGFEEVLASFPELTRRARVVAIGTIGLLEGDEEEEEVVSRQLEMASFLDLPVIVSLSRRDLRMARRVLALLREREFPPKRVLVTGVDGETLRLVRSCGHLAGLVVHPASLGPEPAVRLIRSHGSQGIVLASNLGDGPGDLLGIPRTLHLLERAGISREIARRVAAENALEFFGIDRTALARRLDQPRSR